MILAKPLPLDLLKTPYGDGGNDMGRGMGGAGLTILIYNVRAYECKNI